MANYFLIVAVALAGMGLAVQVALNGRLKEATNSPALAALVSFLVGLFALGILFVGQGVSLMTLKRAPGWAFFGGLFGAIFVTLAATASTKIGPALTLSLAIFGQVVGSILLEHFGLFGVQQHHATVTRLVGAALMLVGVILVQNR